MFRRKNTKVFLLVVLAVGWLSFSSTLPVGADTQCSGSLKKEDFFAQSRAHNERMQANILKARKIQQEMESPTLDSAQKEALNKEFTALKVQIGEQKKVYEQFNAPSFVTTNFNVYGAACNDRRWVDRAREVLWNEPEHLGKTYYVWLDKNTREVKVGLEQPAKGVIAP